MLQFGSPVDHEMERFGLDFAFLHVVHDEPEAVGGDIIPVSGAAGEEQNLTSSMRGAIHSGMPRWRASSSSKA